jgi:hypothetical protein
MLETRAGSAWFDIPEQSDESNKLNDDTCDRVFCEHKDTIVVSQGSVENIHSAKEA